jgi:hypothetical protein
MIERDLGGRGISDKSEAMNHLLDFFRRDLLGIDHRNTVADTERPVARDLTIGSIILIVES